MVLSMFYQSFKNLWCMNYRALLILSFILCTKVDTGHIFYVLCLHAKDFVSSPIKILSVNAA